MEGLGFLRPIGAPLKKSRKTITPEMQRNIWNTHIGTGVKEAPCPLCGVNIIQCPTKRCGIDCAHVVAYKFCTSEPSPLSLYPSCASCNNRCEDECILDFLFLSGRWKQLENFIRSVHSTFAMQNPDLPAERLFMHTVIDHLYGYERYKAGGGIVNDYEIYNLARSLHMKQINAEIIQLNAQMKEKLDELEALSKSVPKRKRPPTIC